MFDTKITNSLTQSVLQTIQKFNCRNVEKSDPILGISLEREGFLAGETGKMANKKPPEALRLQVVFFNGAAIQIRTGDLILTKDALYQLSYSSKWRPGSGSNRRPPA
jgi:hypothetical protein